MCTISVIPSSKNMVFTFNRDERLARYTPHFFNKKALEHKQIYYPQDSKAGGTWIAADNLGNAAMLFNGAFVPHTRKANYVMSRGILLLQLVEQANMLQFYKQVDLQGVEPCSILLYENKVLHRLTWDDNQKHIEPLSLTEKYIFSSATLYDETIGQQRKIWLEQYCKNQQSIDSEAMLYFHTNYESHDKQNGLVINRPESCSTLSISQIEIGRARTLIKHIDLKTNHTFNHTILRT